MERSRSDATTCYDTPAGAARQRRRVRTACLVGQFMAADPGSFLVSAIDFTDCDFLTVELGVLNERTSAALRTGKLCEERRHFLTVLAVVSVVGVSWEVVKVERYHIRQCARRLRLSN